MCPLYLAVSAVVPLCLWLVIPRLKPLLISGYLIGFLVHRKKEVAPTCATSVTAFQEPPVHETGAAPLMDWDDVRKLFADKISPSKFESVFRSV